MVKVFLLALVACAPASESVAVSGIGVDNRASFQAQLDAGLLLDLRGMPGRYEIGMPPSNRRPFASLVMSAGSHILGDGAETIVFVGDPLGHDWAGIRTASGWLITGVNLEVDSPTGAWTEQTHLIETIGPQVGGEISYATLSHPFVAGSSRGDCWRLRCYEPLADGTADRRCWDQVAHHVVFKSCARSSVSVYAALHGASRVHHTTHLNTCDQDLDEEGLGSVEIEWDHNIHMVGACQQSALAISIYPGSTHLHHNTILGRGVDILGGVHEIDHNTVTLDLPSDDPVVYERKAGSAYFHDETWTRNTSAGRGAVFVVAQKLTAPVNVRLDSVQIFQHTAAVSIAANGIVGFHLDGVHVVDDGPAGVRDAVRIEGTNSIRADDISIANSSFAGAFRASVSTTSSYAGVGKFDMYDNSSTAAFRCDGTVGPISYRDNSMPAGNCQSF